jgi:hypothetical protein
VRREPLHSWVVAFIAAACLVPARAQAQLLPPLDEPGATPPLPPVPPPPPPHRTSSLVLGALSLDAFLARPGGSTAQATTGGALASFELAWVTNSRLYDGRYDLLGALGYGGGQVAGELRVDLLLGLRGYFTDAQGPFVRVGLVSHRLDNASFSRDYTAGAGEAGYQYMTPSLSLEVGAQGGLTLRDSALVGGFATLAASQLLMVRAEWQRFYETSGTVVDEVSTRGCVTIRRVVPVCLTFWSDTSPTMQLTESYATLSIGFGAVFTSMTREK